MVFLDKKYKNENDLIDSTRGDCPHCPKGLLSISIADSFKVVIGNKELSFDVVVCDRCDYMYLERWISGTDSIKIEFD